VDSLSDGVAEWAVKKDRVSRDVLPYNLAIGPLDVAVDEEKLKSQRMAGNPAGAALRRREHLDGLS
jgi:hypothetical protein